MFWLALLPTSPTGCPLLPLSVPDKDTKDAAGTKDAAPRKTELPLLPSWLALPSA